MKSIYQISLLLSVLTILIPRASGQERSIGGGSADKSLLQRFDTSGDGKIDDTERRAVREKMKQMQNKPGAMTPSGKSETIGNRIVTEMQYASSDGKMIPCVLSMPQGNGPFPMLVTIHGGQGNRDLGYIRTMAAPNNLSPTISAFNGGVMTMNIVCHLADRIAGAGVLVATLPRAAETTWPKPSRPIPVVIMLGTEDPMKPWSGNQDQMSAEETVYPRLFHCLRRYNVLQG